MKSIALIVMLFMLSGCLDPETTSQDTQASAFHVGYMPFVDTTASSKKISLYKIKAETKESVSIYNAVSESDSDKVDILNNFLVFGNYIYFDFVKKYDLPDHNPEVLGYADDGVIEIEQLRVDTLTDYIEKIGKSSHTTDRVVLGDSFYIKQRDDIGKPFYIARFGKDGGVSRIDFDSAKFNDLLTELPMIAIENRLYMSTRNSIVAYDPNLDNFLSILDMEGEFEIVRIFGQKNILYIYLLNWSTEAYEIWAYDLQNKTPKKLIQTLYHPYMHRTITYKSGSKIFVASSNDFGANIFFCLDTESSRLTMLPAAGGLPYRFRDYRGQVYYIGKDENGTDTLWKSDGTYEGTKKVTDRDGNVVLTNNHSKIGERLYFSNRSIKYGEELWAIDDSEPYLLIDINKGTSSSHPKYMTEAGNGIVFQASQNGKDNDIYYYADGVLEKLK